MPGAREAFVIDALSRGNRQQTIATQALIVLKPNRLTRGITQNHIHALTPVNAPQPTLKAPTTARTVLGLVIRHGDQTWWRRQTLPPPVWRWHWPWPVKLGLG